MEKEETAEVAIEEKEEVVEAVAVLAQEAEVETDSLFLLLSVMSIGPDLMLTMKTISECMDNSVVMKKTLILVSAALAPKVSPPSLTKTFARFWVSLCTRPNT